MVAYIPGAVVALTLGTTPGGAEGSSDGGAAFKEQLTSSLSAPLNISSSRLHILAMESSGAEGTIVTVAIAGGGASVSVYLCPCLCPLSLCGLCALLPSPSSAPLPPTQHIDYTYMTGGAENAPTASDALALLNASATATVLIGGEEVEV